MRTITVFSIFALVLLVSTSCSGNKAGNAASKTANAISSAAGAVATAASSIGSAATMPNCGAAKPVWVNLKSRAYHEPDDPLYGKTKHGEYLCPDQATAQGFHPAGKHRRHHRGGAETGSSENGSM